MLRILIRKSIPIRQRFHLVIPMKTITTGGIRLAVQDVGSGPVLLLVHGFPLDHSMWRGQAAAFSATHRVIAPDLRGFGASRRAQRSEQADSIEQFADDLNALLDALHVEKPVVFCGLSMGGYIAWQFFRKYRERVGALILCDTRSGVDTPEGIDVRKKMAAHVLVHGSQSVADAMLPKLLCDETLCTQPKIAESLRSTIVAADPAAIAAGQLAMAGRPDSTPLLPKIDVPTLLIVGQHDAITTVDMMQDDAAAIAGAKLAVIPSAGHMAPLERPTAVNEEIRRFLKSLTR